MPVSSGQLADLKRQTDLLRLIPDLRRVARSHGGEWAGPCPFCGGRDRFRVQPYHPAGGRWWCRRCSPTEHWEDAIAFVRRRDGCGFREAVARLGGPPAPPPGRPAAPRPPPRPPAPAAPPAAPLRAGPVLAVYDYRLPDGRLCYQVLYPAAGGPRLRRATARGWVWAPRPAPVLLYRAAALAAADPARPVWLVPGEPRADRLAARGRLATALPGGAPLWGPACTAALAGRRVVVLPGAGAAAAAHAAAVVAALTPVAAQVRLLPPPGGAAPGGRPAAAGAG